MAAEYALKAFLMLNKRRIPRTHDLVELLDECLLVTEQVDLENLRENCQILTRYRVEFVYPSPLPEQLSVDEARQAIEISRDIYISILRAAEALGYQND
jgi:HEPN domain-containing protein